MGEQKVTVTAEAKGTDKAARGLEKVVQAEEKLAGQTKRVADTAAEATHSVSGLVRRIAELAVWTGVLWRAFGDTAKAMGLGIKSTRRMSGAIKPLTMGLGKLVLSLKATSVGLRAFGAVGAIVYGVKAINEELKREIAERRRLTGVIRDQAAAMDELKAAQRDEQADLERVAGSRRSGGFATADVSSAVTKKAQNAQKQFTQLGKGDIASAFGTFGDVEGLSQKDLTDLAIIASFGDLDTDKERGTGASRRYAERVLGQFRGSGRIGKFRRTETVQGQGIGDAQFRPEQTERGKATAAEAFTEGKETGLVRERLKELLMPGSDIEKFLMLSQMHGSPGAMAEAEVGFAGTRGATAMYNALYGNVEVGLKNQPGYLNDALESAGIQKNFVMLRSEEWEDYKKAAKTLAEEGLGGGKATKEAEEKFAKDKAERMPADLKAFLVNFQRIQKEAERIRAEAIKQGVKEGVTEGMAEGKTEGGGQTVVHQHMQHAQIVYPDADAVRRNTFNGESDNERREVG